MIRTPHDHLTTIITGWDDLRALVTTRPTRSTRIAYVKAIEAADAEEVAARAKAHAAARDDMRDVLGDRPVPLSLSVLDTIHAIEEALLSVADQVAAVVQRPSMSHAPYRAHEVHDWDRSDVTRRNHLADDDARDVRRWTYSGTRTAPAAAAWLLQRLMSEPGPFRPLPDAQRALIGKVAGGAAERMERVLGSYRTHAVMERRCPWCTGELTMHHGGDDLEAVTCATGQSCTAPVLLREGVREWRGLVELAALEGALGAAERRLWERDRKRAQRAGSSAAA